MNARESQADKVRQILAEVEREKRKLDGAEDVRRTIRLSGAGGKYLHTVARFRYWEKDYEVPLSGGEQAAIYDALGLVKRDCEKRIDELEAQVAPVAPLTKARAS